VTVSESSRRDIADQLGVSPGRISVVPVGVDSTVFRPMPAVNKVPGRIMTTASSDVPMKGLLPLLEALAKLRTEREDAHLVVVGRLREGSAIPAALERLGLKDVVRLVSGVSDQAIVELYAESQLAVVPSLYEGFSLPAIEAMACGVPLIATTAGALPRSPGETATRLFSSSRTIRARSPWPCRGCLPTSRFACVSAPRPKARVRALHLAGDRSRYSRAVLRASGVLTVDFARLGLRPAERVLDIGCGAGRHAFECLRRGRSSWLSTRMGSRSKASPA